MNDTLISQSEIQAFVRCRYKWYLSYVKLLGPKVEPTYFEDGSVYHNALENLSLGMSEVDVAKNVRKDYEEYAKANPAPDAEDYNLRMLKVQGMVQGYVKHYGNEYTDGTLMLLQAESEFKIKLDGFDDVFIVGKKDKRILKSGEVQLVEHKTAGQIGNSYIKKLPRDQQTLTYLWADLKEHGNNGAKAVVYDVTKKPTIRQKQDETREEYMQRVIDGYVKSPEKNFYRETLRYSKKMVDKFEKNLKIVVRHMLRCEADPKNEVYRSWPSACDDFGGCKFKEACNRRSIVGEHMDWFKVREFRHVELDIEKGK